MPSTIHFTLRNNQMTDVTVDAWDDRTNSQIATMLPLNQGESTPLELVGDSSDKGAAHWNFASSDGSVNSNKVQSDIGDGDECTLG